MDPRRVRTPPLTPDRRLLRILISNPSLAENISGERQLLLESDPAFAAVSELVRLLREGRIASPAALLEVARDSKHAMLYGDVAAETLDASSHEDDVQADLDGVFAQLELRQIQSEYARLSSSGVSDEMDRARFRELTRRLAELKGVADASART